VTKQREVNLSTEILERSSGRRALVRRFHLRVVEGPDSGRVFASKGSRTVVGTHASADFRLADPTMSRFHCEIAISEGKASIRDLGSSNGTTVDSVRVFTAPLSDGAVLALGRTKVRFALSSDHNEVALSDRDRFGLLVGASPAMREVYAMLEAVSLSDATVLLLGETGTGKDVAAHSIHQESDRCDGPLLVVDCGAIPARLLESELFGHERGAFTGADVARPGAFEAASGGTVFLDEIGELSLELQPKLLRVLEARETKRVGGNEIIPVDVRLVAATNRDLHQEVNARRFRSDLYFRLAVVEIELPPLREHKEDLPALVTELLANMGVPEDRVHHHTWPGNGRELRNYLERCAALKQQLPLTGESPPSRAFAQAGPPIEYEQPWRQARREWLEHFERRYLDELLRRHGNNVTAAARAAGVDRVHFHRLLSRNSLR